MDSPKPAMSGEANSAASGASASAAASAALPCGFLAGHAMAFLMLSWAAHWGEQPAHTRSKIAAMPWPQLMHMVTSAYRPIVRLAHTVP